MAEMTVIYLIYCCYFVQMIKIGELSSRNVTHLEKRVSKNGNFMKKDEIHGKKCQ